MGSFWLWSQLDLGVLETLPLTSCVAMGSRSFTCSKFAASPTAQERPRQPTRKAHTVLAVAPVL